MDPAFQQPSQLQGMLPTQDERSYHGRVNADGSCDVWVVDDLGKLVTEHGVNEKAARPLPLCLEVRSHSPTGFAWGYEGSGPAQLALALLVDALSDVDLAQQHYQEFKRTVVSGLGPSWSLSAAEIRDVVSRLSAR
jgi:hypothetical protein